MKKALTPLDIERILLSFCLFACLYLLSENLLLPLARRGYSAAAFGFFRLLVVDGLGTFCSLCLSLWVVSRRYRIVAGTLILMLVLFYVVAFGIIHGIPDYKYLLFFIGVLSMKSVGLCSAISLWMAVPQKKTLAGEPSAAPAAVMPETSRILILLSLASVPAAYFFLAVSTLVAVGLSAFAFLLLLHLPRIPVFLILAVGAAPFISLWAAFRALKAMLFAPPQFEPALEIAFREKPKLNELIHEVCRSVGTRLPDTVLLHATPTFFVTEGKIKTLEGLAQKRTLAIGAPFLTQLAVGELQAVLAHEFAHFSGRDTAYSRFVVPVYRSLGSAIRDLGAISAGNSQMAIILRILLLLPATFLKIFLTYFATIDRILSRSRELRADWIAASHFGRAAMESALVKVVQIAGHFGETNQTLGWENADYFEAYGKLLGRNREKLEAIKRQALQAEEQEFDSYPSLATRLAALPEAAAANTDLKMNDITAELSAEEKKLSDLFQALLKQIRSGPRTAEAKAQFDLLNSVQAMLVRKVLAEAKPEKVEEIEISSFMNGLVMGANLPEEHKPKVGKVAGILKNRPAAYDLFLKGMACRDDLYARFGWKEARDQIQTLASLMGMDYRQAWKDSRADLETYAGQVQVFCREEEKHRD